MSSILPILMICDGHHVGHTISGVQIWWTYCQIAYWLHKRPGDVYVKDCEDMCQPYYIWCTNIMNILSNSLLITQETRWCICKRL